MQVLRKVIDDAYVQCLAGTRSSTSREKARYPVWDLEAWLR